MDLKITKEATPEQARQEWARWLESNEFQQGYNALTMAIHPFTDDEDQTVHITHCCLGVAAEMGCQLGILRRIEDTAYRYVGTEDDEMVDVRSGTLPKVMADFLGIGPMGDLLKSVVEYDNEGEIRTKVESLAGLNDVSRWTFDKIAVAIRLGAFKDIGDVEGDTSE